MITTSPIQYSMQSTSARLTFSPMILDLTSLPSVEAGRCELIVSKPAMQFGINKDDRTYHNLLIHQSQHLLPGLKTDCGVKSLLQSIGKTLVR